MVMSGYNSRLVKAEDAPKSWNDLLDPKWKGKLVKAHPGYSGAITNETYALSHLLGWEFYEKLAKQGVLQVQSATDPPMRCAQGERAVMADAAEVTVAAADRARARRWCWYIRRRACRWWASAAC